MRMKADKDKAGMASAKEMNNSDVNKDENKPLGQIRCKGAGGRGKKCNGSYEYSRHFRKKPLYKNEHG